jgi:hypothetical protein
MGGKEKAKEHYEIAETMVAEKKYHRCDEELQELSWVVE